MARALPYRMSGPACVVATMVTLAGCGHSAPARHAAAGPCSDAARVAFAGVLRVPAAAVSARRSIGNNSYPQCSYRAVTGTGKHLVAVAVANIDTGPQPYFVLERTEVEASQVFAPTRNYPAPSPVKLGLDAWWFPANKQLMTTEGLRLYTVTVSWRGVTQKTQRDLAIAVASTYLLRHRKGAANGFPSG